MTITVLVLDSVGVGSLPDAKSFGDHGAHTLNNSLAYSGIDVPNLQALGIGNINSVNAVPNIYNPQASFGRLKEVSPGKDTTTGHWEFMGVQLEQGFKTFPPDYPSFPENLMNAFDAATGRSHLGNYAASGTVIIEELGEKHLATGEPIVYTSSDSVFQIACHTDIVTLEQLYTWCQKARAILQGDMAVARVIARPFHGSPGSFKRLGEYRKDYSVSPPHATVLDSLKTAGREVIGIGKIPDIYNHQGFTQEIKTRSNLDGIRQTIEAMRQRPEGLIFTNLVEFDSLYGHRRDVKGYGQALRDFDQRLPELMSYLEANDLLIITSDHGNDPTWPGSDHTREYGLLLAYGPSYEAVHLGDRKSFADIGATVADYLDVPWEGHGKSFLSLIRS